MELYERGKEETQAKDDPAARRMLQEAFEKTERWPKGFSGYGADLIVNNNGKELKGKVETVPGKEVRIELGDEPTLSWAKNQIGMMAVHRAPRTFEESDGKYTLTLGEEDHYPLGRLVHIHGDGMSSRYRIRDGRILQINRTMGKMRFTINIQDSITTQSGKHLTSHYTVYYLSVPDGVLLQTEGFTDRHTPVKGVYLPDWRQVLSFDKGEVIVREMKFLNHRIL
jgi:hypothetical protein